MELLFSGWQDEGGSLGDPKKMFQRVSTVRRRVSGTHELPQSGFSSVFSENKILLCNRQWRKKLRFCAIYGVFECNAGCCRWRCRSWIRIRCHTAS